MHLHPMSTLSLLVTLLMMTGSLLPPTPSDKAETQQSSRDVGCQSTSRYEVCTTNPPEHEGAADPTIVRKFRQQVQETSAGDTIRFAMYVWVLEDDFPDTEGLGRDLIDARSRGVDVQIVMVDSPANTPAINLLRDAGVPLALCARNCLPDHNGEKVNVMHAKFLLVQSGDQFLVAHASTNLRSNQYAAHQNLLAVHGDEALYQRYLGFWNRMFAGSWTYDGETWAEADRDGPGDLEGTRAYFFPRSDKDPVREELSRMACRPGHNRLWVAATIFTDSERLGVLHELDRLQAGGCDVRVVVTRGIDHEWVRSHSDLSAGKVRVLTGNHNKLIVADVIYDGEEQPMVFAGSHNLNTGSMQMSSDGMLRVTDPEVLDIYADYYLELFKQADVPRTPGSR